MIPNAHLTLWPDLLESYVGDRRVYQSLEVRSGPRDWIWHESFQWLERLLWKQSRMERIQLK